MNRPTELTDPPQSTYTCNRIDLSESNIYGELDSVQLVAAKALFLKSTKCAIQRGRWKEETEIPKKAIHFRPVVRSPLPMPGNTPLPITFSGSAGADNPFFYQHCCSLFTVGEQGFSSSPPCNPSARAAGQKDGLFASLQLERQLCTADCRVPVLLPPASS